MFFDEARLLSVFLLLNGEFRIHSESRTEEQTERASTMCIAFWLLDEHPVFWLVVALNRDEVISRPTLPAHFWTEADDEKHILAGRDVRGGGTWMGITTTGRFAFVTNVRERPSASPSADRPLVEPERASRGQLPVRFLKTSKTPAEYADEIALEADNFNGFNLVVADVARREMAFVSNRHGGAETSARQAVASGLSCISNGSIQSRWHKMERGKKLFAELLARENEDAAVDDIPLRQIVEKVLRDKARASDVSLQLADTSWPEAREKDLSSIFIDSEKIKFYDEAYGTRSMAVVGIRPDGRVSFLESYLESGVWKDHSFQFKIEGVSLD